MAAGVDQRYYNQQGAFWSPDPKGLNAANLKVPESWNQYAYVRGDPINLYDPKGQSHAMTIQVPIIPALP